MKIKLHKFFLGLCLAALLAYPVFFPAVGNARASFDQPTQKTIVDNILHQNIRIIPQLNPLNFGFGRLGPAEYHFIKTTSKIFFQKHPIEVEIAQILFENGGIALELAHPLLGTGKIAFSFDEDFFGQAAAEDVQQILTTTLDDPNLQYVFLNPGSKIYHLYTCNHVSDPQKAIRMSLKAADEKGFERCGFCFQKVLYLPQIELELAIEREWWLRIQGFQTVFDCSERQAELQRLGEKLLQNWPFPLLGYDYTFYLAESPHFAAFALPAGKIVITSAIMGALENQEELEALLLLAIAHVERRHSLKQYHSQVAEAESFQRLLNLAGAAGSIAGMFAGGMWAPLGSAALPSVNGEKNSQPLLGFQKDLQNEADMLAALYSDIHHQDRARLVALIKKLQFSEMSYISDPDQMNLKIIGFKDRIARVEDTSFFYFGKRSRFLLKEKTKFRAQLDLIYQTVIGQENRVDVYISDLPVLKETLATNARKDVYLTITAKNGTFEFKLLEQYTTEGLWGFYLAFSASSELEPQFLQDIETVLLKIGDQTDHSQRLKGAAMQMFTFVAEKAAD